MSEAAKAPERIWVYAPTIPDHNSWIYTNPPPAVAGFTEYVRADLVQAKDAEIARLRERVAALTADNEALQRKVANKGHDDRCLIWSHEHGCWWRPDSCGYTNDAKAAGIYSRAEAMLISHRGRDGWRDGCKPDELPVRLSDLPNWARAALTTHDDQAAKIGGDA